MAINQDVSYVEILVATPLSSVYLPISILDGEITELDFSVDGVSAEEAGYTITDAGANTYTITPELPVGVVLLIQRNTDLDKVLYDFSSGAMFIASNMDENFLQVLYSQQEVRDKFFRLNRDTNNALDGFRQLVLDVQAEFQAVREQVEHAEDVADTANKTSQAALSVANGIANTAQDAFDTAERAETTANGIAATANQAISVANDAEVQAADAVIKAANATTIAEGIAGTANEANMVAYESRELAVEAKNTANAALAQTTLKPATATVLGGVKVGAGLAVTTEGTLSNTSGMPLGVPMWHNGTEATIPTGHVAMNGQVLSRTAYPAMWAKVQSTFQKVTDTVWSAYPTQRGYYSTGDGSTNFRMPDLNGALADSIKAPVLRGHGGGTVAGETKTVGQMDVFALPEHKHNLITGRNDSGNYHSSGSSKGHVGEGYTASYDAGDSWIGAVTNTNVATENRMNSVYGIWICRVGDTTTEVAEQTKHAVLTGGNTFNGSQKVVGDLEVNGLQVTGTTNLLKSEQALGLQQTYTQMSVVVNTTYTNTEKYPLFIYVRVGVAGGTHGVTVNNVTLPNITMSSEWSHAISMSYVIPPNATYSFTGRVDSIWRL